MTDNSADAARQQPTGLPAPTERRPGDTTAAGDPKAIVDEGTATRPHTAPRPTTFDATVISQRPPGGAISDAPPLLHPLSMNELGKRLEGVTLDQYFLEQCIGGGGMGVVFRALDNQLNRIVAVKLLTARYGEDEEDVRRFALEAQSAARLSHENIAHVYGLGEADGWRYIVFEYIDGENLRDHVKKFGPLTLEDAVLFTTQIAEALEHASSRDLVHRDIKPSNVIITPEGQAKLVDMGLARLKHVERDDDDLTASGMALGTFDYISPEQGNDPRAADVRSDLYSLGCTIYFMLVGQPPFPTGTAFQKLLNHAHTSPPDLRQFRPDIPNPLVAIVDRLLEKDPELRFQRPRELTSALIDFAEGRLGTTTRTWQPLRYGSQSTWARHAPWLIPIVLLGALLLGSEYWLDSNSEAGDQLPQFHLPDATSPGRQPGGSSTKSSLASSNAGLLLPGPEFTRSTTTQLEQPPEPNDVNLPAAAAGPPEPNTTTPNLQSDDVIRVVSSSATAAIDHRTTFASLQAAFVAAESNRGIRRIEIAQTGRFPISPIQVANRDLEIAAAPGYWPILQLTTAWPDGSFFQVTSSRLRIDGVHFECSGSSTSPPQTIFQLSDVETLELNRSWLTIATDSVVSLVQVQTAKLPTHFSDPDPDELPNDASGVLTTAVLLSDCIVRGKVRILDATSDRPVRLNWTNGMLCTTDRLARIVGSAVPHRDGGQHQIDLDHVTAVMDGGLIEIVAPASRPHQLTLDINCTRSIFATRPEAPFLRFDGEPSAIDEFESRLFFGGQRNFYEGIVSFWNETRFGSRSVPANESTNFPAWQERWSASESLAQHNKVIWQNQVHWKWPRHRLSPNQMLLDASPANPARSAAGGIERYDAGFLLQQLPYPLVGQLPVIPW